MSKKKIYVCAIVPAVLLLSGCQTGGGAMSGDAMMMEEKHMMMQSAVDAAMRQANTASYNANVAKQMADEALSKVNMMQSHMEKRGMKMKMMK